MPRLEWHGRELTEPLLSEALALAKQSPLSTPERTLSWNAFLDRRQRSPNKLICADNLKALCGLLLEPNERYHFIYIDPPYNTGQTFAYNDRMAAADGDASSRSDAWLSFVHPRLVLAHRLLLPEGLLCVSIDDHELPNLSVLLREIFGAANHLMTIKWRRKRKPSFLSKHASPVFEYILVFAKDARKVPKLRGPQTSETSRPVLNHGNSNVLRIIRAGTAARCPDGDRAPGQYTGRSLSYELLDPLSIRNARVQKDTRVKGPFRVSQELLDETLFVTRDWGLRRNVNPSEMGFRHMSDDGSDWPTNEDSDREIQECFGDRVFAFAKPTLMLRQLIKMYPIEGTTLRFMDFFAGTGSFGQAVHEQSASDGIDRAFTLIQSPEPFAHPTLPECKTIFDLTLHRLRRLEGLRFDVAAIP